MTSNKIWIPMTHALMAFTTLFVLLSAVAVGGQFVPLGDLPGGSQYSMAAAVSNNSVVVGTSRSGTAHGATEDEAFQWTRSEGMVGLGFHPDHPRIREISEAYDISDDGKMIVGRSSGGDNVDGATRLQVGFLWTTTNGMQAVNQVTENNASVHAISGDGHVLTGWLGESAAYWTGLDSPVTVSADASFTGASSAGQVLIGVSHNFATGESRAMRWTKAMGLTEFLPPEDLEGESYLTYAQATSDDGQISVGRSQALPPTVPTSSLVYRDAVIWRGVQSAERLEVNDDWLSEATAISGDGTLIGGTIALKSDLQIREGVLWKDGSTMLLLKDVLSEDYGLEGQLQDWPQSRVSGISSNGRYVVGSGQNLEGFTEAFLVDLKWPELLGDANFDGVVNEADLTILESQIGVGTWFSQGDFNDDDQVDQRDREILLSYWGRTEGVRGDFNFNAVLDADDIDQLLMHLRLGTYDATMDVDDDGWIRQDDLKIWIQVLFGSYYGDANLDGEFNTGDLVMVFQAGQYEDDDGGNSSWATGDWNGDGDFTTSDLTLAFQSGGFEQGPRIATSAVPEPSGLAIAASAASVLAYRRRKRHHR